MFLPVNYLEEKKCYNALESSVFGAGFLFGAGSAPHPEAAMGQTAQ